MAMRDEILAQYNTNCELYRDFCLTLERLLRELIRDTSIKIHSITQRLKTRESLERKLSLREFRYESLESVTDIAGIRITTYFADDVDNIANLIEREFVVDEESSTDKRATLDPDRFGYLSLHYVVSLDPTRLGLSEYSRFSGCKAEIQTRSILQHAWAEIEHDLGYKTVHAIPSQVRRQFARLAGLLELADEQFTGIRELLREYQTEVSQRIVEEPQAVFINKDSLLKYVESNDNYRQLDERTAKLLGFQLKLDEDSIARNVDLLKFLGINTIAELETELKDNSEAIIGLAKFFAGNGEDEEQYEEPGTLNEGISMFYLCYILLAKTGDPELMIDYLDRFKIDNQPNRPKVAQKILEWYSNQFGS